MMGIGVLEGLAVLGVLLILPLLVGLAVLIAVPLAVLLGLGSCLLLSHGVSRTTPSSPVIQTMPSPAPSVPADP